MTECHKTKTKVITMTDRNKAKYHNEAMITQSKPVKAQVWESASDQVRIGASFASDQGAKGV